MRRLPPQKVEQNLADLVDLAPHLTDDLVSGIDTPLRTQRCPKTGRDYLLSDYNRDGDSYRSPWSNEFDPPIADSNLVPNPKLRKIEIAANDAFDTYRELYFEGGVSSVYMWELEDQFAAAVMIKKVNDETAKVKGSWDSIHVFEVHDKGRSAHYKLTSTIMLYMVTSNQKLGSMNLSGSLTRQAEQDFPIDDANSHVANIGRMVEDMEIKMRNGLHEIYFGKTKDISNDLRSVNSLADAKKQAMIQAELVGKLMERHR
ncbi:hypothetical protein HK104_009414 [Borealophlyctis nickersoniae]|nr:hypothetical protein HK104_009414 [Borealophlyctis nickersoniae]